MSNKNDKNNTINTKDTPTPANRISYDPFLSELSRLLNKSKKTDSTIRLTFKRYSPEEHAIEREQRKQFREQQKQLQQQKNTKKSNSKKSKTNNKTSQQQPAKFNFNNNDITCSEPPVAMIHVNSGSLRRSCTISSDSTKTFHRSLSNLLFVNCSEQLRPKNEQINTIKQSHVSTLHQQHKRTREQRQAAIDAGTASKGQIKRQKKYEEQKKKMNENKTKNKTENTKSTTVT